MVYCLNCVWRICAHEHSWPWKSEEVVRAPELGTAGSPEPSVGAGNQTLEEQQVFLTIKITPLSVYIHN